MNGRYTLARFYYTFTASAGYPYEDGWVEVVAKDWSEAHRKFQTRFPNRNGQISCAFFYTEVQFAKTPLAMGKRPHDRCHECIE